MENNADNIETKIILVSSLLKVFSMFKMRLWYDNKNIDGNMVDNIVIRSSNCRKATALSVKNTNYKEMFVKNVLN